LTNWPVRGGFIEENIGLAGSTDGTDVAAAVGANTKGSYVELIASTAYDTQEIYVEAGVEVNSIEGLFDLAVGAGGSEVGLVENLAFGYGVVGHAKTVRLPLPIPAGSRVSGRFQSSISGSRVLNVGCKLLNDGGSAGPSYQLLEEHGANTGTSHATTIDAGGTADTKGSWTQVVASTSYDWAGFIVNIAEEAARSTTVRFRLDIGVGAAASEVAVVEDIFFKRYGSSVANLTTPTYAFFNRQVPAGSRVAARAQCSSNTAGAREFELQVHGLVA
jgi:hypothetical protein